MIYGYESTNCFSYLEGLACTYGSLDPGSLIITSVIASPQVERGGFLLGVTLSVPGQENISYEFFIEFI